MNGQLVKLTIKVRKNEGWGFMKQFIISILMIGSAQFSFAGNLSREMSLNEKRHVAVTQFYQLLANTGSRSDGGALNCQLYREACVYHSDCCDNYCSAYGYCWGRNFCSQYKDPCLKSTECCSRSCNIYRQCD